MRFGRAWWLRPFCLSRLVCCLLCGRASTVVTIVYLLALYLAVTGVVSLVGYARARDGRSGRSGSTGSLVGGVLLLALALFVFVFPQVVAGFFSLVLGLLLVVGGAVNAARAIELRRYRGGTWTIALVAGIVVALGGVVIVVNPFETTVTFVLVLGVLLVLKGAGRPARQPLADERHEAAAIARGSVDAECRWRGKAIK